MTCVSVRQLREYLPISDTLLELAVTGLNLQDANKLLQQTVQFAKASNLTSNTAKAAQQAENAGISFSLMLRKLVKVAPSLVYAQVKKRQSLRSRYVPKPNHSGVAAPPPPLPPYRLTARRGEALGSVTYPMSSLLSGVALCSVRVWYVQRRRDASGGAAGGCATRLGVPAQLLQQHRRLRL